MQKAKIVLLVFAFIMCAPVFAQTQTVTKEHFTGIWENIRPETGHLSVLEIEHNTPRALWQIRAKTKCAPRDCTWGYGSGKQTKKDSLSVTYNTFNAVRKITIIRQAAMLRATVENIYRDNDKPVTTETYILTRTAP